MPLCGARRRMWSPWVPRLLAAAAVALSMSCGQVAAQEGEDASIVVTLPADLGAAERRALVDALVASGLPISVADEGAQVRELPPEGRVTMAMARWDAALAKIGRASCRERVCQYV